MTQKLSPTAKRAKAIRDKKAAMTPNRRAKKAENQVKRRKAVKEGKDIKGKDYDHYTGSFVSSSRNRAGMNPNKRGTKNE